MSEPNYFLTAPIEQLRVLRKPELLAVVGLSASRIRQLEDAGKFPRRVVLGENAVGWIEGEVREYLAQRAQQAAVKPLGARAAPVPATTPARSRAQRKGA